MGEEVIGGAGRVWWRHISHVGPISPANGCSPSASSSEQISCIIDTVSCSPPPGSRPWAPPAWQSKMELMAVTWPLHFVGTLRSWVSNPYHWHVEYLGLLGWVQCSIVVVVVFTVPFQPPPLPSGSTPSAHLADWHTWVDCTNCPTCLTFYTGIMRIGK